MLMRAAGAAMLLAGAPTVAQTIQPGMWRTTVTVTSLSMPGMPAAQAKASVGKPTTVSACVTPADVAAGSRKVFEARRDVCRTTAFEMAGGRIASKASCGTGNGAITVASSGTYTATSYAMKSSMSGVSGMRMVSESRATRVGPCAKGRG